MILQEVTLVPTDQITVPPRQRRRRVPGQIESLAESIAAQGLINPILIDKQLRLIAGECRLKAYQLLARKGADWSAIPAHFAVDATEIEIHTIELEENIKRHGLFWEDEAHAVRELHVMLGEDIKSTAAHLGLSPPHVWRCLQVANELETNAPNLRNASSIRSAAVVIERQNTRAVQGELEALIGTESRCASKVDEPTPLQILCADFNAQLPTTPCNFLHCDFPYGIDHHNNRTDYAAMPETYDDSADTFWTLCATLASHLDQICSPSCHIMFWFSMHNYQEVLTFFASKTDFVLRPFPLVWHKTDNAGVIPDPNRGPRRIYETAFMGARGDRFIVEPVANVYGAPTTKIVHPSEKPEPMLRHFFRMFVDEHTKMFDPTCGGGGAVRASASLGAKSSVGWEIDPNFADAARKFRGRV